MGALRAPAGLCMHAPAQCAGVAPNSSMYDVCWTGSRDTRQSSNTSHPTAERRRAEQAGGVLYIPTPKAKCCACAVRDVLSTHVVMRASPVGQRTPGATSGTCWQAAISLGPAARWMAAADSAFVTQCQRNREDVEHLTARARRSAWRVADKANTLRCWLLVGHSCCMQAEAGQAPATA